MRQTQSTPRGEATVVLTSENEEHGKDVQHPDDGRTNTQTHTATPSVS